MIINNIPAWVELRKENCRVEVDQKYCNTLNDMKQLASNLNNLFKEHKDWEGTCADVQFDEVQCCKLCNQKYIPAYDEERKEETCEYCGGGKLEYALKILKEAK